MCGICGIFKVDRTPVKAEIIAAMRDTMIARGPDDAGLRVGPGYGLGHRRLAIIDLSQAGRQPMSSAAHELDVVLNGEIYNFRDLRAELESHGYVFQSCSDTEVLLFGYACWGMEALLDRLRGMYAFGLLDHRTETLYLARDPCGKKPLFFHFDSGTLVFASTVEALLKGLNRAPEIDVAAVHDLLSNLCISAPRTILEGVEKIRPGHVLALKRGGVIKESRYWAPDFHHPDPGRSEEEWLDRVEASLRVAIRRRFVADVPVGLLLSGGIDSGLVTALAAEERPNLLTFSVKTQDPARDESEAAAAVAARWRTIHKTLPVWGNVRRCLTQLVGSMGEPLADASAINLFAISELAKKEVAVVMTGDGGDEAFGGYTNFWAAFHAGKLRRALPPAFHPRVAALAARLQRSHDRSIHRAGTLLRYAAAPPESLFVSWLDDAIASKIFTAASQDRLCGRRPSWHYFRELAAQPEGLFVDRIMQAHFVTTLPDDYLTKVDSATMAIGLEARCPFLDRDLLEIAMRVPASVRFAGGEPKGLLRRLASRFLPPAIVGMKKRGFVAPVAHWLREDWPELVDRFVLGEQVEARGLFCRDGLERVVAAHRAGQDYGYLLWGLIVLELWIRIALEGTLQRGEIV